MGPKSDMKGCRQVLGPGQHESRVSQEVEHRVAGRLLLCEEAAAPSKAQWSKCIKVGGPGQWHLVPLAGGEHGMGVSPLGRRDSASNLEKSRRERGRV